MILTHKPTSILCKNNWLIFRWKYTLFLCEVRPETIYHVDEICAHPQAVPWLRRLRAGLSPRRLVFDASSVHVRFVIDKAALGQVSVRLYLVCIIPPMLNAHLLQEGQMVEVCEPSKKQRYYGNRVAFDRKSLSLFVVCVHPQG